MQPMVRSPDPYAECCAMRQGRMFLGAVRNQCNRHLLGTTPHGRDTFDRAPLTLGVLLTSRQEVPCASRISSPISTTGGTTRCACGLPAISPAGTARI